MNLLNDSLSDAICEQIGHEIYNSHIYLYVASYLKNKGLDNIAKIFEEQYKEEQLHANLFISFLTDMNTNVRIVEIPECSQIINNILDIANLYLSREILTTDNINDLKKLSISVDSPVAEEFLRKMIALQQNELSEATTFMDKSTLMDNWATVLLWDASLE